MSATERPLTPAAVAALLGVDPKTVNKWARAGKIPCFFTPGGHRRYYRADIRAILDGTARCTDCGYALASAYHAAHCAGRSS